MNKVLIILLAAFIIIFNTAITNIKCNRLIEEKIRIEVDLNQQINALQYQNCKLLDGYYHIKLKQDKIIENQKKFNEWTVVFSKWTENTFKYLGVKFDE